MHRIVVAVLVVACSSNKVKSGATVSGVNTTVRVRAEPAGAHCPNGGLAVDTGPDGNFSGTLEDEEVTTTSYACNGAAAPAPTGPTCVVGPNAKCAGAMLAGHSFRNATITGSDFSGADLRYADFRDVAAQNVNFSGANLTGARFFGQAGVSSHTIASIEGSNFTNATLVAAQMFGAVMDGCDFTNANLEGADLDGSWFNGGKADNANFTSANVSDTRWFGVSATGADFTRALVNNVIFIDVDLTGAKAVLSQWNGGTLLNMNLRDVDFSRATITTSAFRNINFAGATFGNAFVYDQNLFAIANGSVWYNAGTNQDWSNRNFAEMTFQGPELASLGMNFAGANLHGAHFWVQTIHPINIANANFSNSWSYNTSWGDISDVNGANFSGATFLNSFVNGGGSAVSTVPMLNAQGSGIYMSITQAPITYPEVSNLAGRPLDSLDLTAVTVNGANFAGASLVGARFNQNTASVNFAGANLYQAGFPDPVTIASSNFAGANMTGVSFGFAYNANFTSANFTNATLWEAQVGVLPYQQPFTLQGTVCPDGANIDYLPGHRCVDQTPNGD